MLTVTQLLDQWDIDSEIDRVHLDESSLNTSKLHSKYLRYFFNYKSELDKVKLQLSEIQNILWKYYHGKLSQEEMNKFNLPYDPWNGEVKPLKSQIDKYIINHPYYIVLKKKCNDLESCIQASEEIVKHINWRHTYVKAAVDFMKFQAGM